MANSSANLQIGSNPKLSIITYVDSSALNKITYYYSFCQKQGQTISIISHKRILIYNETNYTLYYTHQPQNASESAQKLISNPKKVITDISLAVVRQEPKSKILSVKFNKKIGNSQNTVAGGEWKFIMETENLAQKWEQFLKAKKEQKTAKLLNLNKSQAGMVNDVLSFGVVQSNPNQVQNKETGPSKTNNGKDSILNSNVNNNNNILKEKQTQNNIQTAPQNFNKYQNRQSLTNSNLNSNVNVVNQNINRNESAPKNTNDKPREHNQYMIQSTTKPFNTSEGMGESIKPIGAPAGNKNESKLDNKSRYNEPIETKNKYNEPSFGSKRSQYPSQRPQNKQNDSYENNSKISEFEGNKQKDKQRQKQRQIKKQQSDPKNVNQSQNPNLNRSTSNRTQIKNQPNQPSQGANQGKSYNNTSNKGITNSNSSNINNQPSRTGANNKPQRIQQKKNQDIEEEKEQNEEKIDWNKKFLEQHNQKTIKQFSDQALRTFLSLPPQDIQLRMETQSKDEEFQPYTITKNNISFSMAEIGTKAANKLKRQFNNYHFILQSCKENKFINVPLTCLIKYLGITCLAKAQFPDTAQVVSNLGVGTEVTLAIVKQLRTLELYTKVSSQQIKKSATILNLSKQYGQEQNLKRIYIQNLLEYLPNNPQCIYPFDQQIRPELILDNISRTINPKQIQIRQELTTITNKLVKQLGEAISENQIIITSYLDLKQILHSFGLNQRVLPQLYTTVRSKFAKRYIHTVMLCIILKYQIERSITDFRQNKELQHIESVIQQALRIYCQPAPTDKIYEQIWRSVATQFKRKFRINLNFKQLEAGFMLSTLMAMINAEYDITKLDKTRKLFQQISIIYRGFVVGLKPKVKMYHRFTTQKVQNVMNFCRKTTNNLPQISKIISLKNPQQIPFLILQKNKNKFFSYLSRNVSPFNSQYQNLSPLIYENVNTQPPTLMSHQITLSYARHCQNPKHNRIQQYKKSIQSAADIINYWLGQDHPLLCDIFESLSDYYGSQKNYEDSINFMKQALTTCIRSTGMHNQKVGNQYFKLAQKQWKYGQKRDAIQNYNKARSNMQALSQINPQYPVLLMRMASLELNQGHPQKCILSTIKAIKSAQQKPLSDHVLIKIYELLCRAYELNHNKEQLKNLSLLTAKVFNSTSNTQTYEQMIRICLVGFSVNLAPGKQQKLEQYVKAIRNSNSNYRANPQQAVQKLMKISKQIVSLQRFIKGAESIQKFTSELKYGRNQSNESREFRILLQLITESVGIDFFLGMINDSKYF